MTRRAMPPVELVAQLLHPAHRCETRIAAPLRMAGAMIRGGQQSRNCENNAHAN